SKRSGLSLIEVLVAIVVLTTGALASISTQVATAHPTRRTRALQFNAPDAARQLESLRSTTSCTSTSGLNSGRYAQFAWSTLAAADLALIRVQVAPKSGKHWSVETLVICP